MAYKDDFERSDGWSAVDTNIRLNTASGRKFLAEMRAKGVDTIIRYYASSPRPKTITAEEAKMISQEGFAILPVFQDSSRQISNFSATLGKAAAASALAFAKRIGQPKGSTILFAVDADYKTGEIDGPILDHFRGIAEGLGGTYKMGAYGSGAVLAKLQSEGLITVPWVSMSRLFLGTQNYFYSNRWALRQIPPEMISADSGIGYDRNFIRIDRKLLGAFQVDENGIGTLAWDDDEDASLSPERLFIAEYAQVATNSFVKTEGLRFRKTPNGLIIRELTIGEPVADLGEAGTAGWRSVSIGGEEGVVHANYLRSPTRAAVENLVRATIAEWIRFKKGQADEASDPYFLYVRDMWAALGEPWDRRSRYPGGQEVPWSAAFISWVVRQAGPDYSRFKFSSSHSVFVNNAIKARVIGDTSKPFWGYRIAEEKPEIGDIIQRNRGQGDFSFSYAENHAQYESHSDIVVEVTPDVVRVMGGNVGDTVSMREFTASGDNLQEYNLDQNGFIKPGQRVIAVLKNRAGT
jgi:hypothetical protein